MPILIMGVVALLVFIVIGFMLFSAAFAESREKHDQTAAGAEFETKAKAAGASGK
jgi:heme/copper-type cytochrome/quinol oxidase subunit 2